MSVLLQVRTVRSGVEVPPTPVLTLLEGCVGWECPLGDLQLQPMARHDLGPECRQISQLIWVQSIDKYKWGGTLRNGSNQLLEGFSAVSKALE